MDQFQEDNNIRPPDRVVTEQLIEDDSSDFDKQIDEAKYLSIKEMTNLQIINQQYEDQILKDYKDETNKRIELFKDFLLNLNKISKFDKEVREIYDILDPIIDSYCGQYFEFCNLDSETYNKIFNILYKIRNNKFVLDKLKTIILIEK
jgi:hypothetical protein